MKTIMELSKKNKIYVIVGSIILVIILVIAALFIVKGIQDNKLQGNHNIQDENNDDSNKKDPDTNTGSEGGIIVEDGSDDSANEEQKEEDKAENDSFQLGEDKDVDDVLTEVIQNDKDVVFLTKEEIEQINQNIFFNEINSYYPNMFLSIFYSCPEEIQLSMIFYMGLAPGEAGTVSDEEREIIEQIKSEAAIMDIQKLPAERVEQVIRQYTGLSLSDYQEQLESFIYLEEYNSYYRICSDMFYTPHAIEDGYRTADGELVLLYRSYYTEGTVDSSAWIHKATVRETEDGGWQFISNERFGVTGVEDVSDAISDWSDYEYVGVVDRFEKNIGKIRIQTYTIASSSRPYFSTGTFSERKEFEIADDCEIIIDVGYEVCYLEYGAMDLLQDKDCFKNKLFFICVKDGKIVKMIEDMVLRINVK